jgi:hypothetical protein
MMTLRRLLGFLLLVFLATVVPSVPYASADSSHARIIRLSVVTGDVRLATKTHGDPLADSRADWSTAQLNQPIREGYVLATNNGRAEVEFENGTLAFLKENTVLEFYDLSLKDGALITRLVLRQGSAAFHVNPVEGDYFSVTGGDFSVEAGSRATFRLDNFDDGTTVEQIVGHVNVLHQDETTRLEKGQSLSMKAGDLTSVSIGRVPELDEFDRWVSGQVDTVSKANAATMQYTNSPSYAAGFGSLYSYGSWFNCGAYGYGWRPFGVGYGWSPFSDGQWIWDPAFGWTWDSFQPWGWAPYHYGGWLFDSGCGGWFYSPPLLLGYYPGVYPGVPVGRVPPRVRAPRPVYRPVTAVFVRNNNTLGFVPMHPLDAKGKTPLNLEHGILSPTGSSDLAGRRVIASAPGEKWQTLKSPPKDAFSNGLVASTAPARVSRTVLESASGARIVSTGKESSIVYDPKEHRYVSSNNVPSSASRNAKDSLAERERVPSPGRDGRNNVEGVPRATARNTVAPPPVPHYSGGGERSSVGGSRSSWEGWSGSRSSGGSSIGGGSMHSAPAPAPAPAPRASSGGGHPH